MQVWNIILSIIFLLILIIGVSLVILFSINNMHSRITTTSNIQPNDRLVLDFPECFDISPDAKNVYKILKSKGMHVKYGRLLDAYSIALCQQKHACSNDALNKRLISLDNWGANHRNEAVSDIVNSITKLKNNKIGIFLLKVCDLCEKQIKEISNDNNILRPDKIQILGFNSQFYRVHFEKINSICSL